MLIKRKVVPKVFLHRSARSFLFISPCELYEWLSKLAESEPTHNRDDPIVWNPKLVKFLEISDYKVVRVVDYLIDSILGSFITEFAIDTFVFYSEAE